MAMLCETRLSPAFELVSPPLSPGSSLAIFIVNKVPSYRRGHSEGYHKCGGVILHVYVGWGMDLLTQKEGEWEANGEQFEFKSAARKSCP